MPDERRIRIDLEYLGTRYAGLQVQPGKVTIQGTVEEALSKLADQRVRIIASGRTDTGVHALMQPVHTDIATRLADEAIARGLNALLPADIAALAVKTVPQTWHAQRSAKKKTYRYTILNRRTPSVFQHGRVWRITEPLDEKAMAEAIRLFAGEHDFSSFRASNCSARSPVRTLYAATCHREGDTIIFLFTGDGFLKQMVRNMTGALVEVGKGKRPPSWIGEVLAAKDRTISGPCAPPEGLCLVDVDYEENEHVQRPRRFHPDR